VTKDTTHNQINYWLASAERNRLIALDLFRLKHYDACLFFCHLALEKILKALVVRATQKPAPYIHDLAKLAGLAGIFPDSRQLSNLRTITTFNIATRYDEYKFKFSKKCTPIFSKKYLTVSNNLYLWLKKEFPKK